jgi:hypothetical protein
MDACRADRCPEHAAPDSPVPLCERHLLAAHDWVVRDVGVTDILPAPCAACGSSVGVRFPSGWICATCEWRVGTSPDGELPRPRIDVVYYLRLGDRIKIGTSGNPRGRFAAIPHDEVLAFERGGRSRERRRHEQFASDRIGGSEWFRASDALGAHIALLAEGADDPWARYALWVSRELALRG